MTAAPSCGEDHRVQDLGIVSGAKSGGAHTSRTLMLSELSSLLGALPADSTLSHYSAAILEDNVLGKASLSGRRRSLRYLRELYILDRHQVLFCSLRDLWDREPAGRPLLALVCALARDPGLRATADTVLSSPEGSHLTSHDLEVAVQEHFGHGYSASIANKIGRNAASSWTQSGHLRGRSNKVRSAPTPTPAATAYALLVGHLDGARGPALLDTLFARALDAPPGRLHTLAAAASARGWIEYKRSGDVVEVGFRWLLRGSEAVE